MTYPLPSDRNITDISTLNNVYSLVLSDCKNITNFGKLNKVNTKDRAPLIGVIGTYGLDGFNDVFYINCLWF